MAVQRAKSGDVARDVFASMLSYHHMLNYPKSGDFWVDGQYVFEVGGKAKSKKQIKDEAAAWVEGKIPLWLFGFLY